MIRLSVYCIMLFFHYEYTGRKNQNMRGQENGTICLILCTNSGDLSQSCVSHPESNGGGWAGRSTLMAMARYISKAMHDILALSCWYPAVFRSNDASLWLHEPCHCFLIISCLGMGHRRRAHICPNAYASHRDTILTISCRLLAMLASLLLFKRQIYLFFLVIIFLFELSDFFLFSLDAYVSQPCLWVLCQWSPARAIFSLKQNSTESGKLLHSVSVYELTFVAQKILCCKIFTWL